MSTLPPGIRQRKQSNELTTHRDPKNMARMVKQALIHMSTHVVPDIGIAHFVPLGLTLRMVEDGNRPCTHATWGRPSRRLSPSSSSRCTGRTTPSQGSPSPTSNATSQ
ncbi:unnamed protein product [Prorocentrum cordatum]|uniref:Uncharacterized protein n=1 Tax=Prorocentrum cordatum TaxID=2364126 RepID=A0ABN9S8Z0_9DINO|nr:unnamed protein product [Polarella glacialis]